MQEALSIPFSLLMDLVAIYQIKIEGAERKLSAEDEQVEFMKLLQFR